jgi:transcriptional regulator, LacI family
MQAMKECGYEIPKDISVIGFDNVSYGMVSDPPLSTMHVYKQELGERAVRELVAMAEGESKAKVRIHVCAEFIERGSVKELAE